MVIWSSIKLHSEESTPWLPLHPNYITRNVASTADQLKLFRKLTEMKRNEDIFSAEYSNSRTSLMHTRNVPGWSTCSYAMVIWSSIKLHSEESTPWLPLHPNYITRNVASTADQLKLFRKLTEMKRNEDIFSAEYSNSRTSLMHTRSTIQRSI
ncbi:hypothetical protein TNIN_317491 [Trichonephila inaurata madagascariensis]|uniref:Uncharacterized protein n=1 Tax=Trichonephila inaurata madagascariensis TaxID=2747483 RepID=A0A8X6X0W3_9ARAC|nr:hypothetical protein TNIN_317491 [Trichonephila inaurata madagascariensis]